MSEFPEFDLYATLHLARDATDGDVRANYLKIMRANHVDHPEFIARIKKKFPMQADEASAEYRDRVGEIAKRSVQRFNVAYEILSDPVQRKAYDRHTAHAVKAPEKPTERVVTAQPKQRASTKHATGQKTGNRQFFNRGAEPEKRSRKTWSDEKTERDKYCIWKQ